MIVSGYNAEKGVGYDYLSFFGGKLQRSGGMINSFSIAPVTGERGEIFDRDF